MTKCQLVPYKDSTGTRCSTQRNNGPTYQVVRPTCTVIRAFNRSSHFSLAAEYFADQLALGFSCRKQTRKALHILVIERLYYEIGS
jgi:membrane-bound lytic murein transglycosylase B